MLGTPPGCVCREGLIDWPECVSSCATQCHQPCWPQAMRKFTHLLPGALQPGSYVPECTTPYHSHNKAYQHASGCSEHVRQPLAGSTVGRGEQRRLSFCRSPMFGLRVRLGQTPTHTSRPGAGSKRLLVLQLELLALASLPGEAKHPWWCGPGDAGWRS